MNLFPIILRSTAAAEYHIFKLIIIRRDTRIAFSFIGYDFLHPFECIAVNNRLVVIGYKVLFKDTIVHKRSFGNVVFRIIFRQ